MLALENSRKFENLALELLVIGGAFRPLVLFLHFLWKSEKEQGSVITAAVKNTKKCEIVWPLCEMHGELWWLPSHGVI